MYCANLIGTTSPEARCKPTSNSVAPKFRWSGGASIGWAIPLLNQVWHQPNDRDPNRSVASTQGSSRHRCPKRGQPWFGNGNKLCLFVWNYEINCIYNTTTGMICYTQSSNMATEVSGICLCRLQCWWPFVSHLPSSITVSNGRVRWCKLASIKFPASVWPTAVYVDYSGTSTCSSVYTFDHIISRYIYIYYIIL